MSLPVDRLNKKKEILIVDDTPDNLRLLSAILAKQNYEVRKALNGNQALNSIKADTPDLILLDIKMPDVSGYQVCEQLKKDPLTQAIPIIFISALDSTLDKVKAFAVGGIDYITKPFQEAEVLARIENQLWLQELQSQLQQQNQALIRSNQELDQFAHIVSHDLQQPLQSILGYAKILDLQLPECVDSVHYQPYLDKIIQAGERMQKLIQGLLNHAQLDTSAIILTEINLANLLTHVLSNLDASIQATQATIHYTELPVVYGDEMQLVQLFQNLIANAIKFTSADETPQIRITAETNAHQGQHLFAVQDNGIGIPAEHVEEIFHRFHRLHSSEEYPGSGIGLSTCRKIIENHAGKIWIESLVGQGTTVYFSLPSSLDTH